jgi:hypothetical protein
MAIIWKSKVDAPDKVPVNTPFEMLWDIWCIGLPFKITKIFTTVEWDGLEYRIDYPRRIWFIGKIPTGIHISGIKKDTTFIIDVGWSD